MISESNLDYLLEGPDLSAQGSTAVACAKEFLRELDRTCAGDPVLARTALALARRLMDKPGWESWVTLAGVREFAAEHALAAVQVRSREGIQAEAWYMAHAIGRFVALNEKRSLPT